MIMFTCFQDITKQKSPFCLWCPSPLTFIFWSLIPNQLRGESSLFKISWEGEMKCLLVFWFSDVEVIESRLRGKHNYCICLKASGLTTFSMHSESDSDQSWQKNPNRNRDAVLPQKATIQHYKIILFKLSCHVSSDCRLWTKLKESKYEIANSVTIYWNRVFSKFRFFACFKPNVTLLEIKVGLTCCSISLLPLSWPFPVRNIVQWKCWCWCLHFW